MGEDLIVKTQYDARDGVDSVKKIVKSVKKRVS